MEIKQSNRKIIASYVKQLKATLICSSSMKKALISEISHQIAGLENQIPVLSMEDLHREIGNPAEIARGFESREDIEELKIKAKKQTRTKIICYICLILVIIASVISVMVIKSNDNYHAKTYANSYIKE